MLYREVIDVCSEIHTKHINTLDTEGYKHTLTICNIYCLSTKSLPHHTSTLRHTHISCRSLSHTHCTHAARTLHSVHNYLSLH